VGSWHKAAVPKRPSTRPCPGLSQVLQTNMLLFNPPRTFISPYGTMACGSTGVSRVLTLRRKALVGRTLCALPHLMNRM
jgi:hypothetical protein